MSQNDDKLLSQFPKAKCDIFIFLFVWPTIQKDSLCYHKRQEISISSHLIYNREYLIFLLGKHNFSVEILSNYLKWFFCQSPNSVSWVEMIDIWVFTGGFVGELRWCWGLTPLTPWGNKLLSIQQIFLYVLPDKQQGANTRAGIDDVLSCSAGFVHVFHPPNARQCYKYDAHGAFHHSLQILLLLCRGAWLSCVRILSTPSL